MRVEWDIRSLVTQKWIEGRKNSSVPISSSVNIIVISWDGNEPTLITSNSLKEVFNVTHRNIRQSR
jgi:hypothetical protein